MTTFHGGKPVDYSGGFFQGSNRTGKHLQQTQFPLHRRIDVTEAVAGAHHSFPDRLELLIQEFDFGHDDFENRLLTVRNERPLMAGQRGDPYSWGDGYTLMVAYTMNTDRFPQIFQK